jgi:hypothetical protein
MFVSMIIVFREVMEAGLIVGIVLAATERVPGRGRWIAGGMAVGVAGDTADEFESGDLNREKLVAPGQTVTVFLKPLSPGEYKFFGDFHQDTAQGVMVAK